MGSFRRGILLGFAIGYTRGAKAGRQRYEQIKTKLDKLTSTPTFKQVSEQATTIANKGLTAGKDALSSAVGKANELQKGLTSSKAGPNSSSGPGSPSASKPSTAGTKPDTGASKADQPGSGAK